MNDLVNVSGHGVGRPGHESFAGRAIEATSHCWIQRLKGCVIPASGWAV